MASPPVALVTGASGAIGGAIARALDAAGCHTALQYRSGGDAVLDLLGEMTNPVTSVRCDVTSWEEVRAAEEKVRADLGPVTVLVNAAGLRIDGPMAGQSVDEWRDVVDVNLMGTFHTTRAVLMGMLGARFGRIVNVVSPAGLVGNAGQTAYASAKAGVVGLTKSLAKEYGRKGITANAVSPGFVASAMTDSLPASVVTDLVGATAIGRPIDPAWVAEGVAYLVGAAGVTGHVLAIDGGMAM